MAEKKEIVNEKMKDAPILEFRKNTEIVNNKVEESLGSLKILMEKVLIIYNIGKQAKNSNEQSVDLRILLNISEFSPSLKKNSSYSFW